LTIKSTADTTDATEVHDSMHIALNFADGKKQRIYEILNKYSKMRSYM